MMQPILSIRDKYRGHMLENYQKYQTLSVQPELHIRTGRPINKPKWLGSKLTAGQTLYSIKHDLRQKKLFTVCEEAKCPNISDCWNSGTATFMILGETCTRACRFCHVKTGNPQGFLDKDEPYNVANTIKSMNLDYAVITMVDRDDLPDGGALHIKNTIEAVQKENPNTRIEILAGDFTGNIDSLTTILHAGQGLDVFAHNVETTKKLTPRVRDARANYTQSLTVLKNAKLYGSKNLFTKSSIMLGLGETGEEILTTLQDLYDVGVQIVTLGQYLQPTPKHLSVKRFVHPDEFLFWEDVAKKIGFLGVASGPLVRSSFKASHLFPKIEG